MTVGLKTIPMLKAPCLIGDIRKIPSSIVRKQGSPLTFVCKDNVASTSFELVPFNRIHWSRYAVYFIHYNNRQDYLSDYAVVQKEEEELAHIEAKTVDRVVISDSVSEKGHRMEAVNTNFGEGWRDANKGGYLMFSMKVLPDTPQSVSLGLLGTDSGNRVFDVQVDGKTIATIDISRPHPEHKGVYYRTFEIPSELVKGKDSVTVKFQAKNGSTAGGIFDVRVVKHCHN